MSGAPPPDSAAFPEGNWMSTRELIARHQKNLQREIDSAALYRAMSSAEPNPQLAELYARLAAVVEKHAPSGVEN